MEEKTKHRTHFAKIIAEGTAENPYFSILYYDHTAKEFCNGYGSYCIETVFKWLSEEFEIDAALTDACIERVNQLQSDICKLEAEHNHFVEKYQDKLKHLAQELEYRSNQNRILEAQMEVVRLIFGKGGCND